MDLLETKILIVAHWLVKHVNRIFSGFGFHIVLQTGFGSGSGLLPL